MQGEERLPGGIALLAHNPSVVSPNPPYRERNGRHRKVPPVSLVAEVGFFIALSKI